MKARAKLIEHRMDDCDVMLVGPKDAVDRLRAEIAAMRDLVDAMADRDEAESRIIYAEVTAGSYARRRRSTSAVPAK